MAKKNKNQVTIRYNEGRDAYDLLIRTSEDDEWGLNVSCDCQRCERDEPDAEPNYVHYSIISELLHAIDIGYEFVR